MYGDILVKLKVLYKELLAKAHMQHNIADDAQDSEQLYTAEGRADAYYDAANNVDSIIGRIRAKAFGELNGK